MASLLTAADRRPRILAVGFHRLKHLLQELAPSYVGVAAVEVLDRGFEQALAEIESRRREGRADVVVAAGSNGAYLRQHAELPVVLVRVGGFDVMRALARARGISARVALVTYGEVSAEVQQFNALFGLGVELRSYRNEPEARDCVNELRARGIEVVVAPGLVADLADEAGMTGVFLYSQDAVREALDDAVNLARVARIEQAKRERLNTILAQLRDGVVAVDMDERVQTLNPAMERLLGLPAATALGRRLGELAPELSLARTLKDARPEPDEIQRLGTRTLVTSRLPIVEQGVQTGAVLTAQDPAAIQRVDRSLRASHARPAAPARYALADLVGTSPAIERVRALARHYARSQATVLIRGESGTGKELLAQGIHHAGPRAAQPFVAMNCAAVPEPLLESELFGYEEGAFTGARRGGKPGLFEAAHTGTLFLDEVGDMPLPLQTRLLRALQEREVLRIGATEPTPVDVRVIAATHRDLAAMVETGDFRRDLYYRLNILRIELPPLRERREDLAAIAAHLLDKVAARLRSDAREARPLVEALVRAARDYAWPGNVRELENLIERLVGAADGAPIDPDAALREWVSELYATPAPRPARSGADAHPAGREALEREVIERALAECGGNRAAAAARLGISRTTLWRRRARRQD
ncbi:MAG TPA: propionate catabolism operon regulatory protein PrpR [Burkholderiaceae bacterium]|nr:propionate catabolism operon regulatory protein PrpR [Burkholderiaceae bacterium]